MTGNVPDCEIHTFRRDLTFEDCVVCGLPRWRTVTGKFVIEPEPKKLDPEVLWQTIRDFAS